MPVRSEEIEWGAVRRVLEHAIDLDPAQQGALLSVLERSEPGVAARVRELLASTSRQGLDPDDPLPFRAVADELATQSIHPPRSRIGRFVVVRVIGAGGMGTVYEARDESLGRTIAIKVMQPAIVTDLTLLRFEHEAALLARLKHPGIAQVYEIGRTNSPDGRTAPYIAMEFIRSGAPLTHYVRDAKLDFAARIDLALKVLAATQHAHQQGVIHRDLKPANILVDEAGQPKVIDFGIARSSDTVRSATFTGRTAGTLRYMSPEQCEAHAGQEHSASDVRSDVYSLGVLLYELFEEESPYASVPDGSLAVLMDEVRSARIRYPAAAHVPDAPTRRDLYAILAKALAAEPDSRYPSAAAFADDLERLRRHEPINARPRTVLHDLRLFARRNRVLTAAVAAVAASLILGAAVATIGFVHAREAQREAERESIRARRIADFFRNTIRSTDTGILRAGEPSSSDIWLYGPNPWAPARQSGEGVRVIDVLNRAAEHLPGEFQDEPLLRAEIEFELACAMGSIYAEDQSRRLLKSSWETRHRILGDDHDDTLRASIVWARSLSASPEQLDRLRAAAATMERRFGRTDPRTENIHLVILDSIAGIGRLPEAITEADRLIAAAEADHGADSIVAWRFRLSRASFMSRLPDAEAVKSGIDLQEQATAAIERLLGPHDPITTSAHFSLGMAYGGINDARAQQLLESVVKEFDRSYGPASGSSYEARGHLSAVLLRQKKFTEAEAVSRAQLLNAREAMGEEAFSTVKAKASLARILVWRAANIDEAESLARQASQDSLAYDEKVPHGDYPAYFRAIWAGAIRLRGDSITAEKMCRELLAARQGLNWGRWVEALLNIQLAEALIDQHRFEDASNALVAAQSELALLKDPGHPMCLTLEDARERLRAQQRLGKSTPLSGSDATR